MYNNLKSFNRGSSLRKGIAMYFANYFDLKSEREKIIQYFASMDSDNNGLLSFDEIVLAYQYKVLLLTAITIY